MNGMTGIWFTPNRQNMRSFGNVLAGNDTRPAGHPPMAWIVKIDWNSNAKCLPWMQVCWPLFCFFTGVRTRRAVSLC